MASPNQAKIDICFVIDATGSMQPYIDAATESINEISTKIISNTKIKPGDLRVSVLAFRDQSNPTRGWIEEWSTEVVTEFTSDINKVKNDLQGLRAKGGGDGPEAVGTALRTARTSSKLVWRTSVALNRVKKYVILITDAPPHNWDPIQTAIEDVTSDPVNANTAAKELYQRNISLFVVKCIDEMKQYTGAELYYEKMVRPLARPKGSPPGTTPIPHKEGATVALKNANRVGDVILALVVEGKILDDFGDELTKKSVKNASKIGANLKLIADGDEKKDEAMNEVKMLLADTQFPALITNIPVPAYDPYGENPADMWNQARKGTEHLEQTVELKYGPINDHQVMRLASLYAKGEDSNNYEYVDENQAQQPVKTSQINVEKEKYVSSTGNNDEDVSAYEYVDDDGQDNVGKDNGQKKERGDEDKEPTLPETGEIPDSYWEKKAAWDAKHR